MAKEKGLIPPQNLDAEESVLGTMLLSPHAITAVSDVLRPEDFYRESHGMIFAAALELDAEGEPVDAITLVHKLEEKMILEKVGGKVRIHELAALVPASANAGHYAEIVREMSQLRKLIDAGNSILKLGWERPGEIEQLQARAELIVQEAVSTSTTGDLVLATDGLGDRLREVNEAVRSGVPIFGLKTGFPTLDAMTYGLRKGQVVTLGARPGAGKSVLAMNIAQNIAERGEPAAIFTLEMSKEELQFRILARLTGIDSRKIWSGKITSEEYSQVVKAAKHLHELPLYIEDTALMTATEIRARARRMKKKVGCEIFIVDYLQLMTAASRIEKRNEQVSEISRQLKLVAKELEIPIIQVSQLNRNTESRDEHRPQLSDLRESGSIEQDSDIVLFIYRDAMYKTVKADKIPNAELIIAKNRGGEIGTLHLLFHGRNQAFLTPAKGKDRDA